MEKSINLINGHVPRAIPKETLCNNSRSQKTNKQKKNFEHTDHLFKTRIQSEVCMMEGWVDRWVMRKMEGEREGREEESQKRPCGYYCC